MNKMKNIFLGLTAGACLTVSSCDVMDVDPTGWYGENVAYASLENLDLYVKSFYGVFYQNADIAVSYVMNDGVSELIKYSWYNDKGEVNKFFYDANYVTAEANFRSIWGDHYTRIRQMNEYFYDRSNGYGNNLDADAVKIRTAEVRFMRAFAYQELALRYGGVVLRVADDYIDGPYDRAKARSSKEDTWDFIIEEFRQAAADLPVEWPASEAGRLTKGAAYGLMARSALYAGRYQDAIDACNEVFNLRKYALMPGATAADYLRIFTSQGNSELILPVYFAQSTGGKDGKQHNFDLWHCPPNDGNSNGLSNIACGATATPSDEYASMFDIKVGATYQPFDWDNLATYGNRPYDNREPRFYASILYNGATWKGRTLELYEDGADGYMNFSKTGQDNVHKSTTGYIFRKFMSEDTKINFSSILSGQYWIEMRLAEIYLIRSEAYARQNNFGDAYTDLNALRSRVGLSDLPQQGSWTAYVRDLSKERACEMGLEGQRSFDLVRWGIAQEVLDHSYLHGIRITKKGDGTFGYERVVCDTDERLFPAKRNIFPIPYSEMKNNSLCEQNAEWL